MLEVVPVSFRTFARGDRTYCFGWVFCVHHSDSTAAASEEAVVTPPPVQDHCRLSWGHIDFVSRPHSV